MAARSAHGARTEPTGGDEPAREPRPTILVPLFAGSAVRAAAPVLRVIARARDADVLLLDLEQPIRGAPVDDRASRIEEHRAAIAAPDVSVAVEHRLGHNLAGMIAEAVAAHRPDLLLLTWQRRRDRPALRGELALRDLLVEVPCDVFVLGLDGDVGEPRRIAVVLGDEDEDAVRDAAVAIAETVGGTITFMAVGDGRGAGQAARLEREVHALRDPARGSVRVIRARSGATGILESASPESTDLLVMRTPPSGIIYRLAISGLTERVAKRAAVPVLVVKPRRSAARSALGRLVDPVLETLPALDEAAKVEVYRAVRNAARANLDFYVMMALATAIAALGLLLDSAAVVIGGMLVAPLMAPLVALGLGVVQGDARLLRLATAGAVRGSLLSVAIGAVIAIAIPNASLTAEVLSRTRPSLLDLGVALAAGAAAAYALSREHLSAALPGVAIAAALVPPLAAAGIALALLDPAAAGGAALLFAANLVSIAAAAGAVFFLLGFRPEPEHVPRIKLFSHAFTVLALLAFAVAIPLTWLTVDSVRAATIERDARAALDAAISDLPGARWTRLDIGRTDDGALRLVVDMETPEPLEPTQVFVIETRIAVRMHRPVSLAVRLIQVTEVHGVPPPGASPTAGPAAGGG
ncbi:MAG: DUF389 domain-containing protein [Dehalococcoidia bacterium]